MLKSPIANAPSTGLGPPTLRRMRVPGVAGFGLHVGKPGACRRVGNANKMIAGGALDLPAGVAGIALQRLVAVRTVELEIGLTHRLLRDHAQKRPWKYLYN